LRPNQNGRDVSGLYSPKEERDFFLNSSSSRWFLLPIKVYRCSAFPGMLENLLTRVGFSEFHLIALATNLEVVFKRKESIVVRRGSIGPFSGSPALLKAGGPGDFEVAQLIWALD
jgi:hypothetical protein